MNANSPSPPPDYVRLGFDQIDRDVRWLADSLAEVLAPDSVKPNWPPGFRGGKQEPPIRPCRQNHPPGLDSPWRSPSSC
jgi:hypothetical protein